MTPNQQSPALSGILLRGKRRPSQDRAQEPHLHTARARATALVLVTVLVADILLPLSRASAAAATGSAVAAVAHLTVSPRSAVFRVGTAQCARTAATTAAGAPGVGAAVSFLVVGANPGGGSAVSDGGGFAQFCYTGVHLGGDTIMASIGSVTDTASWDWVGAKLSDTVFAAGPSPGSGAVVAGANVVWGGGSVYARGDLSVASDNSVGDVRAGGSIAIGGNDAVGSLWAGGDVRVGPNSHVAADARACGQSTAGNATLSPNVTVTGELRYRGRLSPSPSPASDKVGSLTHLGCMAPEDLGLPVFHFDPANYAGWTVVTLASAQAANLCLAQRTASACGGQALAPASAPAGSLGFPPADAAHPQSGGLVVHVDPPGACPQAVRLAGTVTMSGNVTLVSPCPVVLAANLTVSPATAATSGQLVVVSLASTGAGDLVVEGNLTVRGQHLATLLYTTGGLSTGPNTVLGPAGAALYAASINLSTGIKAASNPFGDQPPAGFTAMPDHAPVAANVAVATDEDHAVSVTPSASDADGDALTYGVVTGPSRGTLTPTGSGGWTYTPGVESHGTDSFTYQANDGVLESNVATVTITINPVNDPPVANPDSKAAIQGHPLSFPASDLTANDTAGPPDEAGQTLTVTAVTAGAATHGTVTLASGTVTYSPDGSFIGAASFTYTVCDNGTPSLCATGTVTVTVRSPQPPVASGLAVMTDEDTPIPLHLSATSPNGTPLTYTIVAPPTHGTLTPAGPGGAARTYTPGVESHGTDSFTYKANDGFSDSNVATVTITINPVNDPPVANPDSKAAIQGHPLAFPASDLTANDTAGPPDEAGQTLTVTAVTAGAATHGTVTLASGTVTYSPDRAFIGAASFSYTVCDNGTPSLCATGTVTVTVTADQAPTANPAALSDAHQGTAKPVVLSGSDPDSSSLTFSIVVRPTHGTLSAIGSPTCVAAGSGTNCTATINYTAGKGYAGSDTFTYKVNDGILDSAPATVTVTVVDTAPVAADQAVTAVTGMAKPITLGATDADGDALTFAVGTSPAHGTLTGTGATRSYTSAPGYTGPDHFTFTANDGIIDSNVATVTITVSSAALTSIAVAPADSTIASGITVQYAATGTFSDGTTKDITAQTTWTSSLPGVAGISASGLATGGDAGTTTITAADSGVTGTTTLTVTAPALVSIVITPTDPLILVGDTQAFHASGIHSDGTAENLDGKATWATGDATVATIAAGGTATAVGAGATTVIATFNGVSRSTSLTVKARVTGAPPPTATITSPANNATVTGPADIVGTATATDFLKYVLDYAPSGETTFTTLKVGTATVSNGVLGTFDPTILLNDLYTVRLTVYDLAGTTATATMAYQVARDQKVGNFSLTFQDLNIPLAGIPITINRVYDSRDKRVGGFGFGWSLDIQTLRVNTNRVQGTGWHVDNLGGFLPTYVLRPDDDHKVSITLPDGHVEEFDLTPNPSSSVLLPFQFVTAAYTPRPGTLGTLQPLGDTNLVVNGGPTGPVELLDENTFNSYDPQTFQYTRPDGTTIVIDKSAGVQSITDPNGNSITIGAGGITHSSGKTVAFNRDAQGRITQITDPNGNVQHYDYDANGDLVRYTDAAGNVTRFLYNLSHGLLEVRTPSGVQGLRTEYDDAGRVVATVDALGNRTTYQHDMSHKQDVITDRLGHVTILTYDDAGNVIRQQDPLGAITMRTFDGHDNMTSQTDPLGRTTKYTYDGTNNVTSVTSPGGGTTTYTYNGRAQILTASDFRGAVTHYAYDANNNVTSATDPAGGVTTLTYDTRGNVSGYTDPLGNKRQFIYDSEGHVAKQTDPAGHDTTYSYDKDGNRVGATTLRTVGGMPQALTTTVQYDALNRRVQTIAPDGGISHTAYNALGKPSQDVDALGRATTYTYDALGRLTKTTGPDGLIEQTTFDAENRQIATVDRAGRMTTYTRDAAGRIMASVNADGTRLDRSYNLAGELVSSTDGNGNVTRYQYDMAAGIARTTDPLGHVTTISLDTNGNETKIQDARGNTTSFVYDNLNRPAQIQYPDGTNQQTVYDAMGQVTAEIDQAGHRTGFSYDGLGHLTSVTDPLGQVTQYAYDEVGNRVTTTDANGHTTSVQYDQMGRETKRTLPDGSVESQAYDAAGNLVSSTDYIGRTTTYSYDASNRLLSRTYPDGSAVGFTYSATGQRLTASDGRGVTSYSYDSVDRLAGITEPDGQGLQYGYDHNGNLTTRSAVVGSTTLTTSYTFDGANQLTGITDDRGRTYSATYDATGNRTKLTYPNGVHTDYTYDSQDRLVGLKSTAPSGTVQQDTIRLDPTGARTAISELDGTQRTYQYDAAGQLVDEKVAGGTSPGYEKAFTYDPVGNRTKQTTTGAGASTVTYSYDSRDRLTTASSTSFGWDANGNLVSKSGTAAYTWDFSDRLTRIAQTNGSTTDYQYDVDGNKVQSRVTDTSGTATVTNYLVDTGSSLSQVVAETDPSGQVLSSNVLTGRGAPGTAGQGQVLATDDATGSHFFLADGLGSVRATTSANGSITDTYAYTAFGELSRHTGTSAITSGFAGQPPEADGQLSYMRARHYDPSTGRFISMDPFPGSVSVPISLNRYPYAANNPADRTDPSGQQSLGELGVTLSVSNILTSIVIGGITGAIIGALDAYLGGRDVTQAAIQGGIIGAILGPLSLIRIIGTLLAIAGVGLGTVGAFQALMDGNYELAAFRIFLAIIPLAILSYRYYNFEDVRAVDPATLRWSQNSAGGNGRADVLRVSLGENGWQGPPIDAVETPDGLVTIDHTRAAVALELGMKDIPVRVHQPSDPLPPDMVSGPDGPRFVSRSTGQVARTWGEAAAIRAGNQNPSLPPTGSPNPPTLPPRKVP